MAESDCKKIKGFRVLATGLLCLMQDLGRSSYMNKAISQGGPVDIVSFIWNNALLGNDKGAAQLEIHSGMLHLEALADCCISFCGYGSDLSINQKVVTAWCRHRVKRGDRIFFHANGKGQVAYLAVVGGFLNQGMLGSRSSTPRLKLGPFQGANLQKYAILEIAPEKPPKLKGRYGLKRSWIPPLKSTLEARFIPGFGFDDFPEAYISLFLNTKFKLTKDKNRMGLRLSGANFKIASNNQFSEGVLPGAIQILSDGNPVILGPDAQTIGGYKKIGTVISLDLGILYNLPFGADISFKIISATEARAQKKAFLEAAKGYFKTTTKT